ncbi:MAG: hypothetical protein WCI43_04200 [Candidatus Firestonebacteria bacterium]
MKWTEEQNTVILLARLKDLEGAVSALYASFAGASHEPEKAFWEMLSKAKNVHSCNIDRMKDIFRKKKKQFSLGLQPDWHNIEEEIIGVKGKTELVQLRALKPETFLAQARMIENGLMELKYDGIIKTDDSEYNSLCNLTVFETAAHYRAVIEKLKEAGML